MLVNVVTSSLPSKINLSYVIIQYVALAYDSDSVREKQEGEISTGNMKEEKDTRS